MEFSGDYALDLALTRPHDRLCPADPAWQSFRLYDPDGCICLEVRRAEAMMSIANGEAQVHLHYESSLEDAGAEDEFADEVPQDSSE